MTAAGVIGASILSVISFLAANTYTACLLSLPGSPASNLTKAITELPSYLIGHGPLSLEAAALATGLVAACAVWCAWAWSLTHGRAHERHGLEVQVHGVHGHDLRAPHVGLGLVLGDVGAHRRVGDRDSQREHRLDAAPALGLGELLAVVVLRVEDLRDPGVVPAVHHVGVGLNESERPHGCGAAVSRDELAGLAVGHHDERRDLAVHLDAAGEPGHVSSSLRFW